MPNPKKKIHPTKRVKLSEAMTGSHAIFKRNQKLQTTELRPGIQGSQQKGKSTVHACAVSLKGK